MLNNFIETAYVELKNVVAVLSAISFYLLLSLAAILAVVTCAAIVIGIVIYQSTRSFEVKPL